MYGFPPRTWAFMVSMELLEYLGSLPRGRGNRAQMSRFLDEEGRLVDALDRFARAKSTRNLGALESDVLALKARAGGLGLGDDTAFVSGKLDEIASALRAVACESARPVVH